MKKKITFLILAILLSYGAYSLGFYLSSEEGPLGGTVPVLPSFRTVAGIIVPRSKDWVVALGGSSTQTGELRLLELSGGGTNYIGFKAPDAISSNIVWVLPATDSTGTQYLRSDGSYNLSWGDPSGVSTFLALTDVPASYSGESLKYVRVNTGETALEFTTSTTGASTALDNLASVAINTSLLSDADSTDDLGGSTKYWANAYIDKIYLDADSTIEAADVDTWITATLTEEQVEDFVGGMLGGTETLITVTYEDATNDIDFVVDNDLANYSNATSGFLTSVAYGDLTGSPSDVITAGTGLSWSIDTLNWSSSGLTWAGNAIDISNYTNLVAGTNITLVADTLNVDDSFIKLVGDTTGALTEDLNIDANTFVISYDDNKVGIGTASPNAPLEVKGAKPGGNVGGFQSGMFHVTGTGDAEFSNSVITGHSAYDTNTQLWYLGSTSSSDNNIAFINRQNAAIHFSTNNALKMIIEAAGDVGINVTDPDTQLEVLYAGNQLKLSFDGTDNAIFAVDTSGDLTITPSGTQIIVSGNISATNLSGTNTGDNDEVGTLTNTKWCTTDGSVVNCATNAPILTEVDPNVNTESEIEAITGAYFGASKAVTAGYIWVADGTDFESVAMSSDCTLASGGAITCDHDALDNFLAAEHVDWEGASAGTIHTDNYIENVTHTGDVTGSGALTIANDKVLEVHFKAVDAAEDEECLTYESTTGDFEWQTCGGTGLWTDGGTYAYLTTTTDDLVVGSDATATAPLFFDISEEALTIGAASAGDSVIDFYESANRVWTVGLDDSDSDAFKISTAADFASGNAISIATGGAITFNGAYTFPTADGTSTQVLATDGSGTLNWTAAGAGDVLSVGNCLSGVCLDGTSDGGTNITFYNIDSNKTQLIASDTASDLVITLPAATGTLTTTADTETVIFKAKIAFEDPVATDDFFFGEIATKSVTFTSIYCKTLVGTVDLDVQIAGVDINGTDITCNTTGVLDDSLGGDTAGATGEELKLAITSVASSPTYLMVIVNGFYDF